MKEHISKIVAEVIETQEWKSVKKSWDCLR